MIKILYNENKAQNNTIKVKKSIISIYPADMPSEGATPCVILQVEIDAAITTAINLPFFFFYIFIQLAHLTFLTPNAAWIF